MSLGDLRNVTMLAVARLGQDAYAKQIRALLSEVAGRDVAVSTVFVTLTRLEDRGLLRSETGEPPARGGRRVRVFSVTECRLGGAAPHARGVGRLVGRAGAGMSARDYGRTGALRRLLLALLPADEWSVEFVDERRRLRGSTRAGRLLVALPAPLWPSGSVPAHASLRVDDEEAGRHPRSDLRRRALEDQKEAVSCALSSVLPSWRELSIWTPLIPLLGSVNGPWSMRSWAAGAGRSAAPRAP